MNLKDKRYKKMADTKAVLSELEASQSAFKAVHDMWRDSPAFPPCPELEKPAKPVSYLSKVSAATVNDGYDRCKVLFEAAKKELRPAHVVPQSKIKTRNFRESATELRLRDGFKFSLAAATTQTPYEFSRLLLEISGHEIASAPDPIRTLEISSHRLPLRTLNDSLNWFSC